MALVCGFIGTRVPLSLHGYKLLLVSQILGQKQHLSQAIPFIVSVDIPLLPHRKGSGDVVTVARKKNGLFITVQQAPFSLAVRGHPPFLFRPMPIRLRTIMNLCNHTREYIIKASVIVMISL
jgi:hypothetical protein